MLIVCPTCTTAYQIKLAALGETGRTVRCASCKNTWFATPESAIEEPAPAPVPARAPAQASASAGNAQPPADDFGVDFTNEDASNFSVETATPLDDPAAAEEAAKALAVMDAPPLAPTEEPGDDTPGAK